MKFLQIPQLCFTVVPIYSEDNRWIFSRAGETYWVPATLEFWNVDELLCFINNRPEKIVNWRFENIKLTNINYDMPSGKWQASFIYDLAQQLIVDKPSDKETKND